MYQSYFGLTEAPFSIAPSPRYLFMSQRHQEALAHLLYGINGDGGFVLLTGEVGTGKTTVCRCLLEQIPETCDVAYIFNPKLTVEELLSTICVEFGIACPPGNASIKVFVDRINEHLLSAHAKGRHAVLIIDEAQNLSPDVLEQMRLLTNLETDKRKLLQIILIGQPELGVMLEHPELRQLAQRIVARYHLGALTRQEVTTYVQHRLEVAGTVRPLFPASLMGRLHRLSGGIPRVINLLCDRALLGTFVQGKERVDRATLARATREVFPKPTARRPRLWQAFAAGSVALAGAAIAVGTLYLGNQGEAKEKSTATQTMTPVAYPSSQAKATLDWPSDIPIDRSEAMAYANVFRSWGMAYAGGDPCQQAESQGLRCRSAQGGLDELRALNRPAILLMRDDKDREFHAALIELGANTADFTIGGKTRTIHIAALAKQWSGHYNMLWRVPPMVKGTLRPGERGPAVAWLIEKLAQACGEQTDVTSNATYDYLVTHKVKLFQLEHSLIPDGTAGPQTLIRLVGHTDKEAPSLSTKPPEERKGA